jgi:hypothetical protein
MSSLLFFKRKKPGCFQLCMRDGVNCPSTQIRCAVGCLNVVFTCFAAKKFSGYFVSGLYLVSFCYHFLRCRLHTKFYKKTNSGYFVTGIFLIMAILPNRSIAIFKAGYFVMGIYLKWVVSYCLIDQYRFFKGHFDLGYSVTGLFYTC